MTRYPIFLQDSPRTCGVYCIKMILKYYGLNEDVNNIKIKARVDASGTTIKGLIETFRSYNIEAKGYHATLDDIKENKLPLPCILHLVYAEQGHFVVLYEMKEEEYVIGDPAKGLRNMSKTELAESYSGYMIAITHIGRYYDYHESSYKDLLASSYQMYKSEIRSLISFSIALSILSVLVSAIGGLMIDVLKLKTPLFIIIAAALSYFLLSVLKSVINTLKEKKTILFERALDKEYVYRSVANTLRLPEHFFEHDLGMTQARLTNLYQLSQYTTRFFEALFIDGLMIILLTIALGLLAPLLALIAISSYVILFAYIFFKSEDLLKRYKAALENHDRHASAMLELLRARDLYRHYFKQKKWLRRYEQQYEKDADATEEKDLASASFEMTLTILSTLFTFLILLAGLFMFHEGRMTIGRLFIFYTLYTLSFSPLLKIAFCFVEYQQNNVLYDQYKEFSTKEAEGSLLLSERVTDITLDDVSFSYGYHEDILRHFDLKIDQTLFITGANGSGKSTLFYLLRGLDLNYKGTISFNGHSLKEIKKASLYDHIGYCGEFGEFIHGTLLENLACDDEQAIQRVFHLLEADKLGDKLFTMIEENGAPFSQGEKQLLSLARCLLHPRDVLLLDETFSHISFRKAKRVLQRIQAAYPETIFLIITHQTNLMNKGAKYVIIDKGKMKEIKERK